MTCCLLLLFKALFPTNIIDCPPQTGPESTIMETIDEQWNSAPAIDIMSRSWPNIIDAKMAVKTWILDRGESWGPSNESNGIRLLLHYILHACDFYI